MTKELLQQYSIIVDYLGKVLGPDYEVVLHDLTGINKEVVAIANGHISGRKVGSPLTNAALHLINFHSYETQDFVINYTGETENGHLLRSSTMFIKNRNDELEGLLCINFDDSRFKKLNLNLLELIHGCEFAHNYQNSYVDQSHIPSSENLTEKFSTDIPKLMDQIFEDVTKNLPTTPERLNQAEKIEIISQLNNQGLFRLKGAIPFTAKKLSCSTSSIYRYLNNL